MGGNKNILLTFLIVIVFTISFTAFAQPSPTTSTTIKLSNLYNAFGAVKTGLKQDFGFSCLIEYKGKTILFDAGTNSEIFQQNLKTLNIDSKTIEIIILSHGHYDHMGGLDYLLSVNPNVKIYLPNDFCSLGASVKFPFRETEPAVAKTLSKDEQYFRGKQVVEGMVTIPTGRFWKGNVKYLSKAEEVLPGLTIIPTTSQLMGTFIKYPPHENNPQFIGMPELSVSLATPNGHIIIAGCSHSTIETIIQETLKIRKENIHLVTGGFHLIPYERAYIEGLAKRMQKDYAVKNVAPAHCTGHLGFSVFKQVFGTHYKFFGLGQTLQF
jgi:7,8-dihydropterin-6-yl-methyl-4-(beta-D-ribofuranosyl)aminobenzene 5'-phosphate synthase